jgi:SulP family sulfate permease
MLARLADFFSFFLRPVEIFRGYRLGNLRPDAVAGLTVAVILLPQAMAYALIAELPLQFGLYAAIVAAVVGALWGSSNHLQTGPTNAISLLILSTLLTTTTPDAPEFLVLAGLMAVLVGVIQVVLGLARLGVLVNFVSHSVIVGFSSGAGVLIAIKQLPHLLRLEFSSHNLVETVQGIYTHLLDAHRPTVLLGLGTILLIVLLRRLSPKLPGPLIGMVAAAAAIWLLGLDRQGVVVLGKLPRGLPPLAKLPLLDLELLAQLSTGALAVAAIGLVEAMSISRSIASQTGQVLDNNQEFVGQGLANIAAGLFSGYPGSGSFTRSAVTFKSGGQTPVASMLSGIFVLVAMLVLAPFATYVPRTALAGVLILTAYGMIDRQEIARIWRGARADAVIMIVTFLGTLFLHLEFAVLTGILLSFAVYIMKTSVPEVSSVLPDENFRHFVHQPRRPPCPQLAILDIHGDLYFGAVSHIEKAISQHLASNPDQRFLLLRMHSVDQCDFSGIHGLEGIVRIFRERGGDVFMVRVQEPVRDLMESTGFCDHLGIDHYLSEDEAIPSLFHKILDPAICIYECDVKAFRECQNLPKQTYARDVPCLAETPTGSVPEVSPEALWQQLCGDAPPLVIDVREPREYERGHIPQAQLLPLPRLLSGVGDRLTRSQPVILVCRGGRRSTRAACILRDQGYDNVAVLRGGLLAWEAANLLEAVDERL